MRIYRAGWHETQRETRDEQRLTGHSPPESQRILWLYRNADVLSRSRHVRGRGKNTHIAVGKRMESAHQNRRQIRHPIRLRFKFYWELLTLIDVSSQYGVNRPAIRFCPANRRPRTTFNECMAVNGVMPLIAPIRQGETSTYSVFRHSGSGMPTANTVNEQDVSCLKHTMTFAMMFVNKNRLGSILFWTIFCKFSCNFFWFQLFLAETSQNYNVLKNKGLQKNLTPWHELPKNMGLSPSIGRRREVSRLETSNLVAKQGFKVSTFLTLPD